MPVNTTHPTYDAMRTHWRTLRDAFAGSDAIRAAGETYLPRPSGMKGSAAKDAAWAAYLARPEWYNATARTVKGLTGAVFRKDPEIEIIQGDGTDLLRRDMTGTGVSLLSFLGITMQEVLHMGRYGILLDWDEERQMPVWSGYTAESILNWDEADGTFIVLEEQCYGPSAAREDRIMLGDAAVSLTTALRVQWRVLSLLPFGPEPSAGQADTRPRIYRQDLFRQSERTGPPAATDPQFEWVDSIMPTRRGMPLDFIPFVFLGPETTEPAVAQSVLMDLVRLNLRYWRHSADYEHGLHMTCIPTPWITGHNADQYRPTPGEEGKQSEPVLVLGAGEAIVLPEDTAKIGLLVMSADDLGAMINALETDKKDMATLGARLLEERSDVQETATAVRLRHSGDASVLRTLANTVSFAATHVLRWAEWWAGMTEDREDERGRLTLNTDFVAAEMSPQLLEQLRSLQHESHMSEETVFYNLNKGGLIEPGISFEEERARIELNPPMVMRLGTNEANPFADDETPKE